MACCTSKHFGQGQTLKFSSSEDCPTSVKLHVSVQKWVRQTRIAHFVGGRRARPAGRCTREDFSYAGIATKSEGYHIQRMSRPGFYSLVRATDSTRSILYIAHLTTGFLSVSCHRRRAYGNNKSSLAKYVLLHVLALSYPIHCDFVTMSEQNYRVGIFLFGVVSPSKVRELEESNFVLLHVRFMRFGGIFGWMDVQSIY